MSTHILLDILSSTKRLTERSDWPGWYTELHFVTGDLGVWDLINPDDKTSLEAFKLAKPEPPERGTDLNAYNADVIDYKIKLSAHNTRENYLHQVTKWIRETVSAPILEPILMDQVANNDFSTRGLVRKLKEELAPTHN